MEGAPMVWGNCRLLERQYAGCMDGECPGLDNISFHVRVQQFVRGDRSLQTQRKRASYRTDILRSGGFQAAVADDQPMEQGLRFRYQHAIRVRGMPRPEHHHQWSRRPADTTHLW